MTKKFKLTKPTVLMLIIALFFVQNSALFLGLNLFRNEDVNLAHAIYASEEIDLSNSNFESPSSSIYPITPNSFTGVGSNTGITSGLIDTKDTEYTDHSEDYNLTFNPGTHPAVSADETKVLMINAETSNLSYGYKSANFTLAKNGYYTIEFYVYTQDVDGITSTAGVYLSGDEQVEEKSNFMAITTYGVWEKYRFYVQTDSLNAKTLNLEFFLGSNDFNSQGAVFFDEIKIYTHSNLRYFTEINNIPVTDTNYTILNLKENVVAGAVVNSDFEQTIVDPATNNTGWTLISEEGSDPESEFAVNGVFNIGASFDSVATGIDTDPTDANIINNTKALLINNINAASIGFKSSDILIEQYKPYKLTVWVKTSDTIATVKLVQQNPYGEESSYEPKETKYSGINTTTTTNPKYEDWQEVSIYVLGSEFLDSTVNLELWLGDDETTQAGYAWFDNVTLTEITSEEYESNSTSSSTAKLNLANASDGLEFSNAGFNNVLVTDLTEEALYIPNSWVISSDSSNYDFADAVYGVINTNTTQFNYVKNNLTEYDNISNPGRLDNQLEIDPLESNNVVYLGNNSSTSQMLSSVIKDIDVNGYYEVSLYVQTQGVGARAGFSLSTSGTDIYTINNIVSDYNWTKVTIYVKGGVNSLPLTANLKLGDSTAEVIGHAFFDNVLIKQSTETAYLDAIEADENNTYFADFGGSNINAISPNTTDGLYTPLALDGEKVSTGVADSFINAGILNTDNFAANSANFPGLTNPESADANNPYVITINNLQDAHFKYTDSIATSLSPNSYYTLSVFVKTSGLGQDANNEILDANGDPIVFGASLYTSLSDKKFSGINTQLGQTTNEYQEYIFYIQTGETIETVALSVSLGDTDALTTGYAFFSNINLSTINEQSFNEATESLAVNALHINVAEESEEEEPGEGEDETVGSQFDYLLIPSLIMAIALIIAIVGYSIRQIKFNKLVKKKIKMQMYDRTKSLKLDHDKRQKIKEREQRLKILKDNLKEIETKLTSVDKEYKQTKQDLEHLDIESLITVEEKEALSEKQLSTLKKQKQLHAKKEKRLEYQEKRANLQKEFNRIEKEIETLEREERYMFEEYRVYRSQVKAIKQELKAKQAKERLKLKNKKLKAKQAKAKEKANKTK